MVNVCNHWPQTVFTLDFPGPLIYNVAVRNWSDISIPQLRSCNVNQANQLIEQNAFPASASVKPGRQEDSNLASLLRRCLRPGNKTEIMVHHDDSETGVEVRESRLLDLTRDKLLVLAQPQMAFLRSDLHKDLDITFLIRFPATQKVRYVRAGYPANLAGMVRNYNLSSGGRESVILVPAPTRLTAYNLRMHPRLTPPLGTQIHLPGQELRFIVDEWCDRVISRMRNDLLTGIKPSDKVLGDVSRMLNGLSNKVRTFSPARTATVMDVSLGGIRVAHHADISFTKNEPINFLLNWEGWTVDLSARMVREGNLPDTMLENGRFTCLQYMNLSQSNRDTLKEMLELMQKDLLSQGVG
jgi:hypothetical protein